MNLVLALLALSITAWAALRMLRRHSAKREDLVVLSRAGLSQKAGLAVVSVFGKRVLVGYGEGTPTLLMELQPLSADQPSEEACRSLDPSLETTERVSPAAIFSRALSFASRGHRPRVPVGDDAMNKPEDRHGTTVPGLDLSSSTRAALHEG